MKMLWITIEAHNMDFLVTISIFVLTTPENQSNNTLLLLFIIKI